MVASIYYGKLVRDDLETGSYLLAEGDTRYRLVLPVHPMSQELCDSLLDQQVRVKGQPVTPIMSIHMDNLPMIEVESLHQRD